ncbi:MAG: hypothetical protein ACXADO_11015 [Candidatus Thorarchaeota archaeon]|jgi:hypothetical protein
MTTEKKDYTNYIMYVSNNVHLGSLFAVFTFTVITLLITQLPDPSLFFAQVILFFLAFIFDFLLFMIGWSTWLVLYFCLWVPPMTKPLRGGTVAAHIVYQMFSIVIILMFLLWNLVFLALAAFLMWGVFLVLTYLFIYRPLTRFRETRARLRGQLISKAE